MFSLVRPQIRSIKTSNQPESGTFLYNKRPSSSSNLGIKAPNFANFYYTITKYQLKTANGESTFYVADLQ